jgi:hypothetical protein
MGFIETLGPIAHWLVLNKLNWHQLGLSCLPKHGKARGNKFFITHPMPVFAKDTLFRNRMPTHAFAEVKEMKLP